MQDDLITDGQVSYIMRLLDERAVTRSTAGKIIMMLEDCNRFGDNGMDTTFIKQQLRDEQRKEE